VCPTEWRVGARGGSTTGTSRRSLTRSATVLWHRAVAQLLAAIDAGTFRTRGRRPFKPSTRRAVEQTYRLRVADRFGRVRLDKLAHVDLELQPFKSDN
jgi:hypothetical protein